MKVFKFGGASINSVDRYKNTGSIIQSAENEKILIVISAMGKTTNALESVVNSFYAGRNEEALQLFQRIKSSHLDLLKYLTVLHWQKAENQLKDFVKGGTGQNFLTGLLQARVAQTPIDPVAGNPVSYMARLVDNDYDLAIEGHQAGTNDGGLTLFGITPSYNSETLADLNVKSYNLPMRYNHFFNNTNNLIRIFCKKVCFRFYFFKKRSFTSEDVR